MTRLEHQTSVERKAEERARHELDVVALDTIKKESKVLHLSVQADELMKMIVRFPSYSLFQLFFSLCKDLAQIQNERVIHWRVRAESYRKAIAASLSLRVFETMASGEGQTTADTAMRSVEEAARLSVERCKRITDAVWKQANYLYDKSKQ